ncbi:MAG TPA: acyl-CoA dehydrogenase family protein [Steroidobacteraceae bacterium]|nr:acyl-CoA dehydrogenase family protein [Steroidobacteraceae bacterium]
MDFNYSNEQMALQETLQRFIARDYGFEQRRELARSTLGFSAGAWAQYASLGLLSLPFPEEYGGLGGNGVDIMLVMELAGRGLLLEPYLSSVVMGGGLIRAAAAEPLKRSMLPRIGAGELKLALACYEAGGRYDLSHVACTAVYRGGGWRLSGEKTVVLDAPSADYLLVSARSSGEVGDSNGISLFLVAREAPGVSLSAYPTQSGGRAADVGLEDVALDANALIGVVDGGLSPVEWAVDQGIAGLCAEAVGIIAALNEATLTYLKTRKQFGVPIGKFQALQHRMADMLIAAEQARSMAVIAAVAADAEDARERRRAISGAKAYIGQAARLVGQQAVQLHGAMGVVDELIVSHYFKRLTMIDLSLGNTDFHLERFSNAP